MTRLRKALYDAMQARGFAERTQETYVWAVKGLADFYRRAPDRISEADIQVYLTDLSGRRSPSTVHLAWNGIAFFYRAVLNGFSEDFHPTLPKKRQRQPDILSEREVDAILKQAGGLRNEVALTLAYSGGLRVDELRSLTWADIDYDRKLIRVDQGKGAKDRFTTLADRAIRLLDRYEPKVSGRWLFPGKVQGRPLTESCLQGVYNRAKERAGVRKRGSIHALRHAFATHGVERGTPLPAISHMMGHRSVMTTMRYVHLAQWDPRMMRSPMDVQGR